MNIVEYSGNAKEWDDYVQNRDDATPFHQIGWKRIIEKTFGHQSHYLMIKDKGTIKGILPLFLIRSRLLGTFLISLPFVDCGGVIADSQQIASLLIDKAIEIAENTSSNFMELRNLKEIEKAILITKQHKVTFILVLNSNAESLWKNSFSQNVRNKIRKAEKNLLISSGNDHKYIYNFYEIFCRNMRDLGTPVYPLKYFINTREEFPHHIRVFTATYKDKIIGAKLVFFYKDTMFFSFHSSYRTYFNYAPNNLLYWASIKYACEKGYTYCNMGRSTINSGPYDFKKQWGPEIRQLYWQYYLNKAKQVPNLTPNNPKFSLAIKLWKHLPLRLTKLLGPLIIRNIP